MSLRRDPWCPRAAIALAAIASALAAGASAQPGSGGQAPAEPRTIYVPMPGLRLETVATGLDHPLYLTAPPGDPRLFVVEQGGRIRILDNGRVRKRPFLDLSDSVRTGAERGLLSVAFHPDYAHNGLFFVNYTDRRGDTRIERYRVTADPDSADRASAHLVLAVDQPYPNHNGGLVMFGPDGMLWIGMGDGGGVGDRQGNAQNQASLLGKLLRIDVDHGDPYAVPPDNPFVHRAGARAEIWAYGLRNPWRFCFDVAESLLIVADVGQDRWEEVDAVPLRFKGLNFGWNLMEGSHPYRESPAEPRRMVRPIAEYGHDEGCSITGGFVYRGQLFPDLYGHYVFSDFCRGWIRSFRYAAGHADRWRQWARSAGPICSFGQDAAGELYAISLGGRVAKLVRATPPAPKP
jgi:hypothetical protein